MYITKASGDRVKFNRKQYENTLQRVGLTPNEAREIGSQIYQDLKPNILSDTIYQKTQKILKKKNQVFAAKYSLKRAIMELGPDGYFFERYMSSVLRHHGYETKYNQFIMGRCNEHEVDIVAERNNQKFMIECKYHRDTGQASDLKVALYTYARFLDLKDKHNFTKAILLTNTRCTSEAIHYAKCVGLRIIAWRYPNNINNLEHYIESKKLYPVTVLLSLNKYLNKRFREENLVLTSDLAKYKPNQLSKKFRINLPLARRLIAEAQQLIY